MTDNYPTHDTLQRVKMRSQKAAEDIEEMIQTLRDEITAVTNDLDRRIAEVLEVGGYATCDPAGSFQSFLEKAVYDYAATQEGEETDVWIAYEKTYYKLYIRKQDQVFAH